MTDGFTWTSLFAQKLIDKGAGSEPTEMPVDEALQGKHVGLYFSAHWCPPCRAFTPQLAKTYAKLKKDGKDFEIVFVSMDRSQEQFDKYFNSMPWLAVPWRDDQLRSVLGRRFKVAGIPHLLILAPDGTVVSANARSAVGADPNGDNFPWPGTKEARSFNVPWLLLVILLFYLINTYLYPKPKA